MKSVKELLCEIGEYDEEIRQIRREKQRACDAIEFEQRVIDKLDEIECSYIAERSRLSMMTAVLKFNPRGIQATKTRKPLLSIFSNGCTLINAHPAGLTTTAKS